MIIIFRQGVTPKSRHTLKLVFTSLIAIAFSACNGGAKPKDDTPDTSAYDNADGISGGQMYSKFWADETGFSVDNSNLNDASQLEKITGKSDFFRCKQCHGWDRLGRDGGYSNRAPSASRPNVADVDLAYLSETASAQELFDGIKSGANRRSVNADLSNYNPDNNATVGDQMPNYGEILTDAQIWDIVKYLKEEALDTAKLYDLNLENGSYPTRGRSFTNLGLNGSAAAGDTIYQDNCAVCHGGDGTEILVDGGEYTVGQHMRKKPYEDQHKVKFGHLGSIMGPILMDSDISDIQDLFAAMQDTQKYPDIVVAPEPEPEPQPEPLNGAALFGDYCAGCHTGNGMMGSSRYGDVTNKSSSSISRHIQSVSAMNHLSFLTTEQIDAIAQALRP